MTAVAHAIALVWGALVWVNWYRWNATGPEADWMAFTASAFALVPHLPPGAFVAAWTGHAGPLLLLGGLGLAAFGAGSAMLGWLGLRRRPVQGLVEAVALGAGLGGFIAMGLGFAGLSFDQVARVGTGLFLLLGAGGFVRRVAGSGLGKILTDRGVALAVAVAGVAALIPLCGAVAPETSIDAQLHHLAQPSVFHSLHKVVAFSWNEFSWHPALAHLSFLHALSVGGLSVAKLVSYGWFLLLIVFVVDWAAEHMSWRRAVFTGAGFALLPYVQLLSMRAYPDLATVGYTAIMMRGLASGSASIRLTGLWAGLAAATKITGLLAPAVGVTGLMLARAPVRAWMWSGGWSLVAVGPWCVRNLLASGNPFAPLLPGVFATLDWDPASYARHLRDLAPLGTEPMSLPGAFAVMTRPWNVSVRNTGVMDPMAGIGGWFLWLLPVALAAGARLGRSGWLLVIGAVVWNLMPRLVRYSMPLWPATAVAAAVALRAVCSGRAGPGLAVVGGLLLAWQVPLGIARQHHVANPVGVACGAEPEDRYLARGFPEGVRSLEIRDWIRRSAGSSRVLMLTPTGLWLTYGPGAVFQTLFDRPLIVRISAESDSSERMLKRFRQLRIRYTLYQPTAGFHLHRTYGTWAFDEASAARWRAFWEARAVRVFSARDRIVVHRFSSTDGRDGRPLDGTLPGLDERWLAEELAGDPARLAAIAESRNSAAAWEHLGAARLARGDEAGARVAFARSLDRGRRSVATLSAVGFLAARQRRWREAEAALGEALAVDPDRADVRDTLARVLAASRSR